LELQLFFDVNQNRLRIDSSSHHFHNFKW